VTLVRVVLGPKVVKKSILCKNRKDQAMLVNVLEQELLMPMNFGLSFDIHQWMEVKVHQENCDYLGISMEGSPRSLLGDMDIQEILKRRKQELVELERRRRTTKLKINKLFNVKLEQHMI